MPNEIRLAEERGRRYWEKHAARFFKPGLSRYKNVENFSKQDPGTLAEIDQLKDHSELLFSRA